MAPYLSWPVLTPTTLDEDCLSVNVWVPAPDGAFPPTKPLPVMLWWYGGAFFSGAQA